MASIHTLQFGAFAKTNVGLPGIPRNTPVQICGVGVYRGKLHYAACVVVSHKTVHNVVLGQHIGPYPASAFTFHTSCTTQSLLNLIDHVARMQLQVEATQPDELWRQDEQAMAAADDLVRDTGAVVKRKSAKRSTKAVSTTDESAANDEPSAKKAPKEPKRAPKEIAQDSKYDNSANWGFRGRLAQRAKDDLANTNKPPHNEEI